MSFTFAFAESSHMVLLLSVSVRNNLLAERVIRVGTGKRSGKKSAQQNLQKNNLDNSNHSKGKQVQDKNKLWPCTNYIGSYVTSNK